MIYCLLCQFFYIFFLIFSTGKHLCWLTVTLTHWLPALKAPSAPSLTKIQVVASYKIRKTERRPRHCSRSRRHCRHQQQRGKVCGSRVEPFEVAFSPGIIAIVMRGISSGTRIFGIYHEYTWYIPCICRPLTYTWNARTIYMDIPWISTSWIYMVYPWIYHVCPHSIDIVHPWIYMVLHGTSFDVYTWYIRGISMDIPAYP